jgi:hypothetical protein
MPAGHRLTWAYKGRKPYLCETSSQQQIFLCLGPCGDKRRPLWPYFAEWCSLLPSLAPWPKPVHALQIHREQKPASQGAFLAWWVGCKDWTGDLGVRERQIQPHLPHVEDSCLCRSSSFEVGHTSKLFRQGKQPRTNRGVCAVSHAWLPLRLLQILASNTSNPGLPSAAFEQARPY